MQMIIFFATGKLMMKTYMSIKKYMKEYFLNQLSCSLNSIITAFNLSHTWLFRITSSPSIFSCLSYTKLRSRVSALLPAGSRFFLTLSSFCHTCPTQFFHCNCTCTSEQCWKNDKTIGVGHPVIFSSLKWSKAYTSAFLSVCVSILSYSQSSWCP